MYKHQNGRSKPDVQGEHRMYEEKTGCTRSRADVQGEDEKTGRIRRRSDVQGVHRLCMQWNGTVLLLLRGDEWLGGIRTDYTFEDGSGNRAVIHFVPQDPDRTRVYGKFLFKGPEKKGPGGGSPQRPGSRGIPNVLQKLISWIAGTGVAHLMGHPLMDQVGPASSLAVVPPAVVPPSLAVNCTAFPCCLLYRLPLPSVVPPFLAVVSGCPSRGGVLPPPRSPTFPRCPAVPVCATFPAVPPSLAFPPFLRYRFSQIAPWNGSGFMHMRLYTLLTFIARDPTLFHARARVVTWCVSWS